MRTRYFKDVQMVPTRLADANMMNLDIKVEEQPTGELSGGFGWSNINGFMVDAGITENNFMGRGQIVQLRGSIAQYQKQALFSFTEPVFCWHGFYIDKRIPMIGNRPAQGRYSFINQINIIRVARRHFNYFA